MAAEQEFALILLEHELELRRQQLGELAADLAERLQWLDSAAPGSDPSPEPPNDWPQAICDEQELLSAARLELLHRRAQLAEATQAALVVWQLNLHAIAEAVKQRERAGVGPAPRAGVGPAPRAALKRHVAAPTLEPVPSMAPRITHDWRKTMQMPSALASLLHPDAATTVPENPPPVARQTASRAAKRRTGQVDVGPQDPRDLVPLATPHDLPTLGPAHSTATPRHRGRTVTEPFVAALDLDGVYLERGQVVLDRKRRTVTVKLGNHARHAERDDLPEQPERLQYRSREGELRVFNVRPSGTAIHGTGLLLDISGWSESELNAFFEAIETLP